MSHPTQRPNRWLLREPSPTAAARLFCLPYSGCGASMYRAWPDWIGSIEVCPVQLPGRENRMREPSYTSYEALADGFLEALAPHLDRPIGLFGHCGSALSAFAVAVRMLEAGLPAAHLYVSSQVAPHEGPYGRFLDMNDVELAQELSLLMKNMGAQPHQSIIEMTLDILRTDLAVNRSFRIDKTIDIGCAVTAIGWSHDTEVPSSLMGGWVEYGHASEKIVLQGEHYQFLKAPDQLLDLFRRTLPG
ncbi:thioesterase II family protein [Streptomyces sp. NPDC088789]|uniref:thioesterase II family protein n=1 Tax=Streptomyces sp. NPDC088789 TaxID=3365899 RepID=UPI00380E4D45